MMLKNKRIFLVILVAAIAGVAIFSVSRSMDLKPKAAPATSPTEVKSPVVADAYVSPRKFGLPVDSFNVIENTVQRNEFLASILQPYNVDNQTIALLAQKSKTVFDVRKIAAGREYTI